MKRSMLLFTVFVAVFISGCGLKPYVDTEDPNYATIQLIPKSKTLFFADDYLSKLYNLKKACGDDEDSLLGAIRTDSDTPSRIAKISAEKLLYIYTGYTVESGNVIHTEYSTIALRPEKNKHYVIEYEKKSGGISGHLSEFHYYTLDGKKRFDIPDNRISSFNLSRDCKKIQTASNR